MLNAELVNSASTNPGPPSEIANAVISSCGALNCQPVEIAVAAADADMVPVKESGTIRTRMTPSA